MGELGMIERTPPPPRVEFTVEDERENAGYMQIQNPAPCAGYFEPSVALGERVRIDQPLGTITDVLGTQVTPVDSQQDGIALVLRTFPYVEAGESLGVILEVDRPPGGKG